MRLISLNIWGGRRLPELLEYLEAESATTDIFCFQEMFVTIGDTKEMQDGRADSYAEITKTLKGFDAYFEESEHGYFVNAEKTDFPLASGQAIFIKQPSGITVQKHGGIFIAGEPGGAVIDAMDRPRVMQYVHLQTGDGKLLTICNVHGCLTMGPDGPKRDSPVRTEQFKRIQEFVSSVKNPYILVGDFNTRPEVQALIDFEKGKRNLIKESGIKNVRSHWYPNAEKWDDHQGDYVIVSPHIHVTHMSVIENDVSDHLPLVVEFEL